MDIVPISIRVINIIIASIRGVGGPDLVTTNSDIDIISSQDVIATATENGVLTKSTDDLVGVTACIDVVTSTVLRVGRGHTTTLDLAKVT